MRMKIKRKMKRVVRSEWVGRSGIREAVALRSWFFDLRSDADAGPLLHRRRIHHLEERKAVEIGVSGVDGADAVFAHEDGDVGIVHQVAAEVR